MLLVFWSLLASSLISSLYEGIMTSEMVVPVPDKIILTFSEMLATKYKLVVQGSPDNTIVHDRIGYYAWKYKAIGLQINRKPANESIIFNPAYTAWDKCVHLVKTAGKTARLYAEYEIDYTLQVLKLVCNSLEDVNTRCYVIPEEFEIREHA